MIKNDLFVLRVCCLLTTGCAYAEGKVVDKAAVAQHSDLDVPEITLPRTTGK